MLLYFPSLLFFEKISDLSEELDIGWSCYYCFYFWFSLGCSVDNLDEDKYCKSNNNKINHSLQEHTPLELYHLHITIERWSLELVGEIFDIDSSRQESYDWHNNIRYKRGDYLSECSTYHDTNSEISNISLYRKFSKFLYDSHKK